MIDRGVPLIPNTSPAGTWRPPWRDGGDVVRLLSAFTDHQDKIWFVGGCVRDALLGRPVADVDLAAALSPDGVQSALASAGIRTSLYGLSHGTVTALIGGRGFEITTLRRDVATDGRRASVSFDAHWTEDAARRDFTFNALYLTPADILYDPFGGRDDLAAGRVRFIGDSAARIQEDYLRILRFFRFHAFFGRGAADRDAVAACGTFAPHLAQLSRERIGHEFFKLIMAPRGVDTLHIMADIGVLDVLFGSNAPSPPVLDHLRTVLSRDPDLPMAARLVCLWPEDGQRHPVLAGLRAPRSVVQMSDRLAVLMGSPYDPLTVYYRYGEEVLRPLLSMAWARDETYHQGVQLLSQERPTFPITARDVMDLGLPAGPRIGRLLKAVEDRWLQSNGTMDRGACLDFLRTHLKNAL